MPAGAVVLAARFGRAAGGGQYAETRQSPATFLLARTGPVADRLRARGLRVRDCSSFGLPGWIRVAAAPPHWRDALLAALAEARGGA